MLFMPVSTLIEIGGMDMYDSAMDEILAAQRETEEEWKRRSRTDTLLMDGIRNRQTWEQFQTETSCPGHLRDRYYALQQNSGILPISDAQKRKDALFLKGFLEG